MEIRPNVRAMMPYVPGKPIETVQRELGLDRVVKLASNENPLGPSPKAIAAVQEAATQMHLYPDGAAYRLREAVSQHFHVPADQIFFGNGSDELIHLLGLVFLGQPTDEVVVGYPSFVRYDASAHLADCRLIRVPLDAQHRHDLGAMARACTANTRLVFVANPNNPTGTIVRRAELVSFLRDLPPQAVVILDEAYFEFAQHVPDFPISIDLIREGFPLIGLRTFSKTYGLAGIRIGYGFASAEIVDGIERAREPFNVNSLAQVAAVAALDDEGHLARTLEVNRQGVERITEALRSYGAEVGETYANFVFADLKQPAQPVFENLLRRGVVIRVSPQFGETAARISVGTPEEVEFLLTALAEVLIPVSSR